MCITYLYKGEYKDILICIYIMLYIHRKIVYTTIYTVNGKIKPCFCYCFIFEETSKL